MLISDWGGNAWSRPPPSPCVAGTSASDIGGHAIKKLHGKGRECRECSDPITFRIIYDYLYYCYCIYAPFSPNHTQFIRIPLNFCYWSEAAVKIKSGRRKSTIKPYINIIICFKRENKPRFMVGRGAIQKRWGKYNSYSYILHGP